MLLVHQHQQAVHPSSSKASGQCAGITRPHPALPLFSSLLLSSFSQTPGMDLADTYITFVRQNQDTLRDHVNDEVYTEKVFDVSATYTLIHTPLFLLR